MSQVREFDDDEDAQIIDDPELSAMLDEAIAEADAHPDTAIPAEKIRGPVLLISGSDDHIWPSQRFADRIVARLQGAGFRHTQRHPAVDRARW